jgi:hypothetical protein
MGIISDSTLYDGDRIEARIFEDLRNSLQDIGELIMTIN